MSSIAAIAPVSLLSPKKPVAGANTFSVPKSPIRTTGTTALGRTTGSGTLASDRVDIAGATPNYASLYAPPIVGQRQDSSTPGLTTSTGNGDVEPEDGAERGDASATDAKASSGNGDGTKKAGKSDNGELSEDELRQVEKLKQRDREVRAHEAAHQSAGGQYAGAASFEYQQGPDGQRYAVGGEVSIDISAEKDPEATIRKMQQVRAAAMAPAQPSSQDHAVAAQAVKAETEARAQANEQDREEINGEGADETKSADNTGDTSANPDAAAKNAAGNSGTQGTANGGENSANINAASSKSAVITSSSATATTAFVGSSARQTTAFRAANYGSTGAVAGVANPGALSSYRPLSLNRQPVDTYA